jgi:hypothetical protein
LVDLAERTQFSRMISRSEENSGSQCAHITARATRSFDRTGEPRSGRLLLRPAKVTGWRPKPLSEELFGVGS